MSDEVQARADAGGDCGPRSCCEPRKHAPTIAARRPKRGWTPVRYDQDGQRALVTAVLDGIPQDSAALRATQGSPTSRRSICSTTSSRTSSKPLC